LLLAVTGVSSATMLSTVAGGVVGDVAGGVAGGSVGGVVGGGADGVVGGDVAGGLLLSAGLLLATLSSTAALLLLAVKTFT